MISSVGISFSNCLYKKNVELDFSFQRSQLFFPSRWGNPLEQIPDPVGYFMCVCIRPSSTKIEEHVVWWPYFFLGRFPNFCVWSELCNVLVESRSFTLFSMIESLHERRREFNYNYLGGKPEMLSNELGQKKGASL